MGLFQDSLKKWFYTNNTSAASSDARVPLLNANGTPKGSDTMSNLALFLGGLFFVKTLNSGDDLNNYTSTCVLQNNSLAQTPQNAPDSSWAGLFVVIKADIYITQIAIQRELSSLHIRIYNTSTMAWTNWKGIAFVS